MPATRNNKEQHAQHGVRQDTRRFLKTFQVWTVTRLYDISILHLQLVSSCHAVQACSFEKEKGVGHLKLAVLAIRLHQFLHTRIPTDFQASSTTIRTSGKEVDVLRDIGCLHAGWHL